MAPPLPSGRAAVSLSPQSLCGGGGDGGLEGMMDGAGSRETRHQHQQKNCRWCSFPSSCSSSTFPGSPLASRAPVCVRWVGWSIAVNERVSRGRHSVSESTVEKAGVKTH